MKKLILAVLILTGCSTLAPRTRVNVYSKSNEYMYSFETLSGLGSWDDFGNYSYFSLDGRIHSEYCKYCKFVQIKHDKK